MSSRYTHSGNASMAVNGIVGTTYNGPGYTADRDQWNCIHTDTNNELTSWWEVDLGRTYTIRQVIVFRRSAPRGPRGEDTGKERMIGVQVYVDNTPCGSNLTADQQVISEKIVVNCMVGGRSQALRGRVVKLEKRNSILNVCEVQVWVCKAGHYGRGCVPCTGCQNQDCDPDNGTCTRGCKAGWYGGETCHCPCSEGCRTSPCSTTDGTCSPCKDGWHGPLCDQTCSSNCGSSTCSQEDGSCTSCIQGWYGNTCGTKCGGGCQSNTCHQEDGSCTSCKQGRYGNKCGMWCGEGCQSNSCDKLDGRCSCLPNWALDNCTDCDTKHYGRNCSEKCGHCWNGAQCSRYAGDCPQTTVGRNRWTCEAGYQGAKCDSRCPKGKYGPDCGSSCGDGCDGCNAVDGTCQCKAGWTGDGQGRCAECERGYGVNCTHDCGEGCKEKCDHVTGECQCQPGFQSQYCNVSCLNGYYGQDCATRCAEGCNDGCKSTDGSCLCKPGWKPHDKLCTQKCEPGTHGNCNLTCGHCVNRTHTCDHVTGHCPQIVGQSPCLADYILPLCAERLEHPDVDGPKGYISAVVGIVIVIIVIVLVVLAVIFYRRKRQIPAQPAPGGKRLLSTGGNTGDQVYANCGPAAANVLLETRGHGSVEFDPNRPSCSKELDDDDLLDTSQDDRVMDEDEKWSTYQSIKVTLDPVQRLLLDRLTAVDKLKTEFKTLPAGLTKPHTAGMKNVNTAKNRFKRLFPYDETRVVLTPLGNDPNSDYINANFIANQKGERAYIATQGPLKETLGAFWRMVCQEKVTQIVMLTNLQENEKVKCHKYWPDSGERKKYDDVTVEGKEVQLRADFLVRVFHVHKAKTSTPRTVTQFHMVTWPDHGVPSALGLVNLLRYINTRTPSDSGPLLVHCSAGVGRTGTYIALDMMLQQMKTAKQHHQKQQVDVFQTVKRMRQDRVIMIQTVDQYVFLHEVLLEAYTSMDTRLTLDDLTSVLPASFTSNTAHDRVDNEFKTLCQMKNFMSKPTYTLASQKENKGKNRDPSVVADDAHLVYLSAYMPGRNQYINAVSVSSFRQQRGLILTQLPVADTVVDFWRLVDSFNVTTVISLGSDGEEQKKDYCHYWPRAVKTPVKAGPYVITMTSSNSLGDCLTSYHLSLEKSGQSVGSGVQVLHLKDWPGEVPGSTMDLLRLLSTLDTLQSQDTDSPVVVQCKDGASRSGLFCALNQVISRTAYDHEVDVYLSVRQIQGARPQAINSTEQYRFCYQVAVDYKRSTDIYGNS